MITSKYRAYPPEGHADQTPKVVQLTNEAKRRYERMGWRFKRANAADREHWA